MVERKKLATAFRAQGWVLTAAQLAGLGVYPRRQQELLAAGWMERVGRGLYRWQEADITEQHSLVIAQRLAPRGVVCLVSALVFHRLTTQRTPEVWMAFERDRDKPPARPAVRMHPVKFSGPAFREGIEQHRVEATELRVYSVAKTVVDCFKFRNKVGLDVALEALREGWRERRFVMDDITRLARLLRVANVMQPYIESLV
ncbi:MAG TPA: type IV toxin-antitoxin system AbiEi family antitoxin domain-containing protein [bacterium]|nr:type IV toxin-antitoxin system AbiEi family antitoxin domain-containing protein [bacterium]